MHLPCTRWVRRLPVHWIRTVQAHACMRRAHCRLASGVRAQSAAPIRSDPILLGRPGLLFEPPRPTALENAFCVFPFCVLHRPWARFPPTVVRRTLEHSSVPLSTQRRSGSVCREFQFQFQSAVLCSVWRRRRRAVRPRNERRAHLCLSVARCFHSMPAIAWHVGTLYSSVAMQCVVCFPATVTAPTQRRSHH